MLPLFLSLGVLAVIGLLATILGSWARSSVAPAAMAVARAELESEVLESAVHRGE